MTGIWTPAAVAEGKASGPGGGRGCYKCGDERRLCLFSVSHDEHAAIEWYQFYDISLTLRDCSSR